MALWDYITNALTDIKTNAEEMFGKYASPETKKIAEQGTLQAIAAKGPYYTVQAVNEGFDAMDKLLGTATHSLLKSASTLKPQIEQGQFTKDVGDFTAQFGEGFRLPGELAGGLFLPPFGVGATRAEVAVSKIERTLLKDSERVTKFADDAAKLAKPEEIAVKASETFPGISKQLAEDFGKRFEKVTDPLKVSEELTKIAETGKIVPSQYAATLSKEFPEIASDIQAQHVVKTDAELYAQVQKIMDEGLDAAETAAKTRLDDVGVVVGQELIRKYINDAEALIAKGEKAAGEGLYTKAIDVAQKSVANLTEGGRFVRAASLISELSPEAVIRMATKEIEGFNAKLPVNSTRKLPSLTPAQAQQFSNEMRRIQRIESPIARAKAIQKLQDKISALVPTPLLKKIITLWKAGLLTGIKTSGLNTASNLSHFVSEIIKDAPATLVDSVASLFTGKRTKAFTLAGIGRGGREGFEKGFEYLKSGFDERNIAQKMDYRKVHFGNSPLAKALQGYEEAVFRTIGAEDQPFYYGAKARSLYDQAIAQAKNIAKAGTEKSKKEIINDLLKNPTDEMLKNAVIDAETAVFQNQTSLGRMARAATNVFPPLEIILPFQRTPASVAMQLVGYTPLGFVKALAEQIGKGVFDQRMFSQTMGRAITGTGLLYLGGELFKKGRIALGSPQSEKEKKEWELEGKTRNSIKIGDTWRSLSVLGPPGLALVVGGYLKKGLEDTGSYYGATVSAIGGLGKAVNEQAFLKSINAAIDALQDPARFGEAFVNGMVGSVVPTIVSDVARATDQTERRIESPLQAIQARVPGWRSGLEPQVSVLGEKRATPDFLTVMIDPTRPGVRSASPVVDELQRLWEAGYKPTPTQLGDKKGFKVLSQDQNTRLWIYAGDLLHGKLSNLIKMPEYQALSDSKKEALIKSFTKKAYTEARATMVLELTDGLSGEYLMQELARLKEGKLLTKDAFTRWQELKQSQ